MVQVAIVAECLGLYGLSLSGLLLFCFDNRDGKYSQLKGDQFKCVLPQVHVFGFGADSDGNWNHYWEKLWNKNLKTGVHPGTNEYSIIEELAKKKRIEFYKGH